MLNHTARALAVLAGGLMWLMVSASPASAHASLLETRPADGVVLSTAPTEIVLRFSEAVGTSLGTVKVLSPTGDRVDTRTITTRAADHEVVAPLRSDLAPGTYLLLWRVVSEDGHPVSGSSIFSVGTTSAVAEGDAGGGGAARRLLGVSRLVAFAGLAVLLGVVVFLSAVDRLRARPRRLRRLVTSATAAAGLGTAVAFLVQGPYGAGLPLSDAFKPSLMSAVAETRFGTSMLIRLVAIAVLAGCLLIWTRREERWARYAAVATGVTAAVATSLAGHAGVGDLTWLAVPLDSLHLVAAGTWVGGLAVLTTVVLPRLPADEEAPELSRLLPRWSRVAVTAVAVLVLTGLFASWREVRELAALPNTSYGRLLIGKSELVLGMLVLGALGREWVQRHAAQDQPPVARLRRSVAWEAGIAAVVLAVTAALVETTPARSSYSPPFVARDRAGADRDIEVRIEPARAGLNELTVAVTGPDGSPADVAEVTARAVHSHGPGHDSGSPDVVSVSLPRVRRGHYAQPRLVLPMPGRWRLELIVRTSEIDASTLVYRVEVR
ncbi:MAG TPA: copper resistance protein CopC [Mycobacteriales bacterium]|nr:copper resistance protein CopC [Mycobacteriales bacterium]